MKTIHNDKLSFKCSNKFSFHSLYRTNGNIVFISFCVRSNLKVSNRQF